jgi:hypothetical protein
MFTWHIRSGTMEHPKLGAFATGYSGRGNGLNNPDMVTVKGYDGCTDAGPIVPGRYTINGFEESHGGFALILDPDPANDMYGRGSFLIHGDLVNGPPHMASEGCIILPRDMRAAMYGLASAYPDDRVLMVVPG